MTDDFARRTLRTEFIEAMFSSAILIQRRKVHLHKIAKELATTFQVFKPSERVMEDWWSQFHRQAITPAANLYEKLETSVNLFRVAKLTKLYFFDKNKIFYQRDSLLDKLESMKCQNLAMNRKTFDVQKELMASEPQTVLSKTIPLLSVFPALTMQKLGRHEKGPTELLQKQVCIVSYGTAEEQEAYLGSESPKLLHMKQKSRQRRSETGQQT